MNRAGQAGAPQSRAKLHNLLLGGNGLTARCVRAFDQTVERGMLDQLQASHMPERTNMDQL